MQQTKIDKLIDDYNQALPELLEKGKSALDKYIEGFMEKLGLLQPLFSLMQEVADNYEQIKMQQPKPGLFASPLPPPRFRFYVDESNELGIGGHMSDEELGTGCYLDLGQTRIMFSEPDTSFFNDYEFKGYDYIPPKKIVCSILYKQKLVFRFWYKHDIGRPEVIISSYDTVFRPEKWIEDVCNIIERYNSDVALRNEQNNKQNKQNLIDKYTF